MTRIGDIVHEKRAITADTAVRLGKYLGTGPEFWLNLQNQYDIGIALREKAQEIDTILTIQ